MLRYLAIDLGTKRTGLASGDDLLGQVGPIGVIEAANDAQLMEKLLEAIDEYGPDELVIGMPLNMDGTAGPAAKRAQQIAARLTERTGLTVHAVDERLSSYAADQTMSRSGLTHKRKKARRDALAAVVILQDFLAARDGS